MIEREPGTGSPLAEKIGNMLRGGDVASEPAPPEPAGSSPVVGSGGGVGPPCEHLHILCCDGYIKGWTADRAWAEQWAAQLDGRTVCTWIKEIRRPNSRDEGRAGNA